MMINSVEYWRNSNHWLAIITIITIATAIIIIVSIIIVTITSN
jgi:hypothetical protein